MKVVEDFLENLWTLDFFKPLFGVVVKALPIAHCFWGKLIDFLNQFDSTAFQLCVLISNTALPVCQLSALLILAFL